MGTAASQSARAPAGSAAPSVAIRALTESDLPEAQRIVQLAFGTFLGAPEPETFWPDRDLARGRWHAPHVAAFAAEIGGELVGSNFATRWGSVGFFGPLTIRPDLWDRGIGARLVEAVTARFDEWGTRHAGLFTFAQSAKHVGLYQKHRYQRTGSVWLQRTGADMMAVRKRAR
jgi:GNAT superfamily N-acetyltransferase